MKRARIFSFLLLVLWTAGSPAYAVKTWISSIAGIASNPVNWVGGAPTTGDDVVFNSVNNGDCTWDLGSLVLSSFTIGSGYAGTVGMESSGLTTFTGAYTISGGTVEFRDTFGPFLIKNAVTVNSGAKLHAGNTTLTVDFGSFTVNSGGMLDFHDKAVIQSSSIYVAPGGALHLFDNNFNGPPTLTSTSTASSSFLDLRVDGTVDISSAIFGRLDPRGFRIGSSAVIVGFSSATFSGPLQAGATAINFYAGGSFTSTFTSVRFDDGNAAVNINASGLGAGKITLRYNTSQPLRPTGLPGRRSGANFENDPGAHVDWPDLGGCGSYMDISANGDSPNITGGVNESPKTLTAGDHCIVVGNGTYNEQVTVAAIKTGNSQVRIDGPNSGSATVSPPAFSTAAFVIANASVTIAGITVRPTSSISYGVSASSPNVTLSSVNVDSGGNITQGGIFISSQSSIFYSSVTAQTNGIFITGNLNTISYSTAAVASSNGGGALTVIGGGFNQFLQDSFTNSSGHGVIITTGANSNSFSQTKIQSNSSNFGDFGLYLVGTSTNAFSQVNVSNPSGNAAFFLKSTSNTIVNSTITSNGSIAPYPCNYALTLDLGASGNSITGSVLSETGNGTSLYINPGANYNLVAQSKMSNNSLACGANISGTSNTVTQSFFDNPLAAGLALGGSYNLVSLSSMTGNFNSGGNGYAMTLAGSWNTVSASFISNPPVVSLAINGVNDTIINSSVTSNNSVNGAIRINGGASTSSNTISNCYVTNPAGDAIAINALTSNTRIFMSSITSGGSGYSALNVTNSTGNSVTQTTLASSGGYGAFLSGSSNNSISQSSVTTNASGYSAITLSYAYNNTISQAFISNAAASAMDLYNSSYTTISQSTITSNAATYASLRIFDTSSTTVIGSYIQGADGLVINASTATILGFDIVIATNTSGEGIRMDGGSQGLSIATASITCGPKGYGIVLGTGNTGSIFLTSMTISGARVGMSIGTPAAGETLTIATMTFSALPFGTTAIQFLGGTRVSTFSSVNFADPNIHANVDANALAGGSRIIMLNAVGPTAGPSFERDPGNFVDWITTAFLGSKSFTGTFASAGGANIAGTGNFAHNGGVQVAIDNVTSGGPYINMVFASSATAQGLRKTPDPVYLARYDSNGNIISQIDLGSNQDDSMALDSSANIYVSGDEWVSGRRWLSKYSPSLTFISSVPLSAAIGNGAQLASDGTFLYAAHDGSATDFPAKIVKYDANLVAIATATYQIAGFQTFPQAIDADSSGNIFVHVSTGGVGSTAHLVQYANTLSGSSVAVDVTSLAGGHAAIARQGSNVYLIGGTPAGGRGVFKFTLGTLAYTGTSYAISNATSTVIDKSSLNRSPDGNLYAAASVLNGGGNSDYIAIKFSQSLTVISSATFNGSANATDDAGALAVLDANTVFVTGASQKAGGTFDAATVKFTFTPVSVVFTGNFTAASGAVMINSNNNSPGDLAGKLVTDTLSSGGPFTYTLLNTSLAPSISTYFIVKYDSAGVKLSSAQVPTAGYIDPYSIALDLSGNVYTGYREITRLFLRKYSSALAVLSDVEISSTAVGLPKFMTTQGNQLYVLYDGLSGGPATAVRYDLNLATLSTVTAPGGFSTPNSLDVDDAGNVYIAAGNCSATCSWAVEKFDLNFTTLLASAPIAGTSSGQLAISAAGPYAYVAAIRTGDLTVTRLLSSNLTATPNVSTFTLVASASRPQVKAMPDGNVYVSALVDPTLGSSINPLSAGHAAPADPAPVILGDGWARPQPIGGLRAQAGGPLNYVAARYTQALNFLSSATFLSPSGSASINYGLAVTNPATVLLSGGINNTVNSINLAVSVQLSLGPLPAISSATCTPNTTALSVSSIRWSLPNPFSNSPTSYNIYTTADSSLRLASVTSTSFDYTNLSTNTPYSISFAGVNASGQGPRSAAVRAYTMAAPPLKSTADGVFATSATFSWDANQNPSDTRAWIDRSTDSAFRVLSTTLAAVTAYTDSGLRACTPYYVRVRNLNGDGVPTSYDSTLSFVTAATTPTAPGAFTAVSLPGNRIAFAWEPSNPEGLTGYNLYYDGGSGVVPSTGSLPLAILPPTATSFTTGVLPAGAYAFHLTAMNRCGVEEAAGAYAAAAATLKPSAIRAAVSSPQSGRGSVVAGGPGGSNALTVSAALLAGDPAKVLFQYKPSSATAWTDIGWAASKPFVVAWDISRADFVGGTFDLRAVAYDALGSADAAPSAVTITVAAAGTPGAAGETVLGGVVTKTMTLDSSVSNTLVTAAEGRMTSLTIPPGALNAPSATVSVVSNPSAAELAAFPFPDGLGAAAGLTTKISLGAGQALLPGTTASFTISYPDADDDGFIDGTTLRADAVRLISNTGLPGALWNQDIATSVDPAAHTITGYTPHFSFFAVVGTVQTNLDSVRVYPVPYKPNGADASEGRPYTGAAGTGIVFDNLPAVVTIKIYTVSGTLVAKLTSNAGTGALVWDARSDAGKDVASGGYFAVITTPGFKSLTKRLAVIR